MLIERCNLRKVNDFLQIKDVWPHRGSLFRLRFQTVWVGGHDCCWLDSGEESGKNHRLNCQPMGLRYERLIQVHCTPLLAGTCCTWVDCLEWLYRDMSFQYLTVVHCQTFGWSSEVCENWEYCGSVDGQLSRLSSKRVPSPKANTSQYPKRAMTETRGQVQIV